MSDKSETPNSGNWPKSESSTRTQNIHVTITVPKNKSQDMKLILKPVLKNLQDPEEFIEILDKGSTLHPLGKGASCVPPYTVAAGEISAPSLVIMLFLPDTGPICADHLRTQFEKFPWRHHHTIQLKNKTSSSTLGHQKFFFLSRHLPLWSVCPSHPDYTCLRINIFTRRYHAMVEFYRLVTNTEMESRKPDFCIFPLHSPTTGYRTEQLQLRCEIALKHCPLVNPYPLTDAYLTFPVQNIQALKTILPSPIQYLCSGNYVAHDPDGNVIILHDVTSIKEDCRNQAASRLTKTLEPVSRYLDKDSIHSESVDSGLFSDFDTCSSELEQCMSRLLPTFDWSIENGSQGDSACNLEFSDSSKTFFV